jgi:hypothetical protein
MTKRRLACIGLGLVFLLTNGPRGCAQTRTTGTVLGTVKDPSGAVIPGAAVTLQNVGTGATFTASTNASGAYSFPAVSVGSYRVTVAKTGFKGFVHTAFTVDALENVRIDAVLEVGTVSQTVSVTAPPLMVNTVTADEGDTVTGTQVNDLPLDSRLWTQLVTLEPGISSPLVQTPGFGSEASITFSGNGVRADENNVMVD